MIRRRALIAAAALPLGGAAALPPGWPADGRIAFRIIRDGTPIGTHVLTFTRQPSGFDVRIAVDMVVRFGPIVLFRYRLNGVERWRDGMVSRMSADTDDGGTAATMRAERDSQGLWVTGSKAARYLAPANALPATHWNSAELKGPWINPQDGRLFHPTVTRRGMENVVLADGRTIVARHYAVSGDVRMQLWYDTGQHWTALLFIASDGSEVRYERI